MIIAPKVEGKVEIGRFYQVPTVRGFFHNRTRNWAVLGPRHEDAEYIDFPTLHYHLDWRFAEKDIFDELTCGVSDSAVYSWVLHGPVSVPEFPSYRGIELGPVIYRRRKCRREFPPFPRGRAPWMNELTEAYSDHVLDDNLVCPHRGASLATVTPDEDGCVVCPLHGLKWNLTTRRIVNGTK